MQVVGARAVVVVAGVTGLRVARLVVGHHRLQEIRRRVVIGSAVGEVVVAAAVAVGPVPAGEHVGEGGDGVLAVGGDGLAAAELRRAVGVEHHQADAEELVDLARVVLVGMDVLRGVRAPVAHHVEVHAHGRAQRDVLQQRAVVAEGAIDQDVVVIGQAQRELAQCGVLVRHHQDLAQGEGHALAQLVAVDDHVVGRIGAAQGAEEPGLGARVLAELLAQGVADPVHVVHVQGRCRGELLVQPGLVADRTQMRDVRVGGTEGRLGEETRRVGIIEGSRGDALEAVVQHRLRRMAHALRRHTSRADDPQPGRQPRPAAPHAATLALVCFHGALPRSRPARRAESSVPARPE